MLAVIGELQKEGSLRKKFSTGSIDSVTRNNTTMNSQKSRSTGQNSRRKTIKDMKKNYNKTKGMRPI